MSDFKIVVVSMAFVMIATLVTLVLILANLIASLEIDDEGNKQWDGREVEEYGVLFFAVLFNLVTLAFVAFMGLKVFKSPTNFRVGVLGGSTAMYANMALICCFYFINFENERERRRLGGNYYYYNNEDEKDNEIEEGRMQRVLSTASFIFSLGYVAMSALIIKSRKSISAGEYGDHRFEANKAVYSSAHADILKDCWVMLSMFSIIAMAISFIVGFIPFFTEEGERMREEGELYNYLLISGWILILVIALRVLGNRTFSRSKDISQTEVGFFAGTLYFFAAGAILTAALFAGISISFGGDQRMEEGLVQFQILVLSCFTFAMAYFAFGYLVERYYTSILHVNNDEVVSEYVAMPKESTQYGLTNTLYSSQEEKKNIEMT